MSSLQRNSSRASRGQSHGRGMCVRDEPKGGDPKVMSESEVCHCDDATTIECKVHQFVR